MHVYNNIYVWVPKSLVCFISENVGRKKLSLSLWMIEFFPYKWQWFVFINHHFFPFFCFRDMLVLYCSSNHVHVVLPFDAFYWFCKVLSLLICLLVVYCWELCFWPLFDVILFSLFPFFFLFYELYSWTEITPGCRKFRSLFHSEPVHPYPDRQVNYHEPAGRIWRIHIRQYRIRWLHPWRASQQ